jgi:hypothetical protein
MRVSIFTLLFFVVAAFHTVIPTQAEAASALFRMKRSWWGPAPTTTLPLSYISPTYHPNEKGPNKAPPASCTLYIGTWPTPECQTIPSKVIQEYIDAIRQCFPFGCRPGYPVSTTYPSYWNVKGRFRSNNTYAPTMTTTVVFPTTGNGEPTSPTTTFAGRYDFSRSGSIKITPGAIRYGGTLKFYFGPNHQYYQYVTESAPFISKAYGYNPIISPSPTSPTKSFQHSRVGDHRIGRVMYRYRMTPSGYNKATTSDEYYVRRVQYISTIAPWTTGRIALVSSGDFSPTTTQFATVTGYDNRTANGMSGVLSLLRPRLVHSYVVPNDPSSPIVRARSFAQIWQLDIHFMPEPGGSVLLITGLATLCGLYRLRRR